MIKPILGSIIVNRVIEDKSSGGIILTNQEKLKTYIGIVIAIAEDVKSIKVGDIAYFTSLEGYEMKADEEQYVIVRQDDVVAVSGS